MLLVIWLFRLAFVSTLLITNKQGATQQDNNQHLCNVMLKSSWLWVFYGVAGSQMDLSRIQELLDCPVCFKPLRNSSKVLPCQHTFCKRCLKNIASTKGFLQCPECRSVFSETSIESLPPNVFLERLVGELHRTDQPGDQQAILWKVGLNLTY